MNNYSFDVFRDLYVRTGNRAAVQLACSRGMISEEDCAKILGSDVNLVVIKQERLVKQSRDLLAKFLEEHPLRSSCHGNTPAYYNVTEEKQNMFSRKFAAHSALVAAGINDVMTWNATGQPCEDWTDAECVQFIAEMNAYVTPLVKYQQHLEVAINACETSEALDEIEINYASLFTTTIPDEGDVSEEA